MSSKRSIMSRIDCQALLNKYYTPGSKTHSILLEHSEAVAEKALILADRRADLNPDRDFVYEAAMLHDIDVVDICTPTYLHHEQVLQAAAAGKHIVCEKPLARTVARSWGTRIQTTAAQARVMPE